MAANIEAAILSRAIDPENPDWPPEIARAILRIALSEDDKARANYLAARAAEGTLSEDEQAEIQGYRRAGRLLELLKSKARGSLRKTGLAP